MQQLGLVSHSRLANYVCAPVRACLVAVLVLFASFFLSGSRAFSFSLCLMPGGQLDPEGFLIDQGTLALRFLLCPRGLRVSLSPCHKPGDHSAVMNGEEAGGGCRGTGGDKALCHGSTQLDGG